MQSAQFKYWGNKYWAEGISDAKKLNGFISDDLLEFAAKAVLLYQGEVIYVNFNKGLGKSCKRFDVHPETLLPNTHPQRLFGKHRKYRQQNFRSLLWYHSVLSKICHVDWRKNK